MTISRRSFVARAAGVAAAGLVGQQLWTRRAAALTVPSAAPATSPLVMAPATAPLMTVYRSSTCGCCRKWVEHVTASGYKTAVHDENDMNAVKDRLGVPEGVRSCHTALIDGYLLEGHVPAGDVKRLLTERPKVMGLAVPGMPKSTPGMAVPGDAHEPYETVAFQRDGAISPFAQH